MKELIARLDEATKAASIDKELVAGIRKSLKKVTRKQPKTYDEAYARLIEMHQFLEALGNDLGYERGMYVFKDQPEGKNPLGAKYTKTSKAAFADLDRATRDVLESIRILEGVKEAMVDGSRTHKMDGGRLRKRFIDKHGGVQKGLDTEMAGLAWETLVKTEALISRQMLAKLTRFLSKHTVASDSIPREATLGKAKLIWQDLPNPSKGVKGSENRHPRLWKGYLQEAERARRLLQSKGLGFLWYGPMFIKSPRAGRWKVGKKTIDAAAAYFPSEDEVEIYQYSDGLAETIVHELGHRLYYRFLRPADRAGFNAWFKTIPAVTSYGATKPEEDFAEAFSWYITGNKLTGPQVERLKQFMRFGGRKIRESSEVEDLLGELREMIDQGVEALVRRAGVDGVNKPKLTPKDPDKEGVVVAKEGS